VKTILTFLLSATLLGCGGYGNGNSMSGNMAAATPVISELVPNDLKAGTGAFTLTVNGNNFAAGSVVYWNGSTRGTMFAMPGQLTAAITAADMAAAGTATVMVKNPGGTGIYMNQPGPTSNTMVFTIEP